MNNLAFSRYYLFRNNAYFFAKYVPEEDIENFAETTLTKFYSALIGYYSKKQYGMVSTIMYALNDFLYNIRGKAPGYKIEHDVKDIEYFKKLIANEKNILLEVPDTEFGNRAIRRDMSIFFINICLNVNPMLNVILKPTNWAKEELEYIAENVKISTEYDENSEYLQLHFCEHVSDKDKCMLPKICVDGYLNCIYDKETYEIYNNFEINKKLFINFYKKIFIQTVHNIRREVF